VGRWRQIGWVTWLAVGGCQGCVDVQPADPDDSVDTEDPPEETDSAARDTAPEPPCPVPEQEPNNALAEAGVLPMERVGCGLFDSTADADFWRFTLTEQAWLGVDVRAFRLGSLADVSLTLSSPEAGVSAGIWYWRDLPDVHVRFPSPPATYDAIIRQAVGEQGSQGEGERFFYEVLATSTKPPLNWDLDEGPNESRVAAQPVAAGPTRSGEGVIAPVVVLGTVSAPTDQDWYAITLPSGRHRVVVEVRAHDLGSMGDFALELYDGAGGRRALTAAGRLGWEQDPWLEYRALVADTLTVRVVEENNQSGRPFWYALAVTVEAE
jgi:hypothetical protein